MKKNTKMIVAARSDGMGARLITLLHAIYMSRILDIDFGYVWKTNKISHADTVDENLFFQAGFVATEEEIFDEQFIRHYSQNSIIQAANSSELNFYLRKYKLEEMVENIFSEEKQYVYATRGCLTQFTKEITQEEYLLGMREAWNSILFHRNIRKIFECVDNLLLKNKIHDFVSVHIRAGDAIFSIPEEKFAYPGVYKKALPFELAMHIILKLKDSEKIVIFSDDIGSIQILKNNFINKFSLNHKGNIFFAYDFFHELKLTTLQIVFFDIYLMSKANVVYANGSSNFSNISVFISNKNISVKSLFEEIRLEEQYSSILNLLPLLNLHPRQKSFSLYHAYMISLELNYPKMSSLELIRSTLRYSPNNRHYQIIVLYNLVENKSYEEINLFLEILYLNSNLDNLLEILVKKSTLSGIGYVYKKEIISFLKSKDKSTSFYWKYFIQELEKNVKLGKNDLKEIDNCSLSNNDEELIRDSRINKQVFINNNITGLECQEELFNRWEFKRLRSLYIDNFRNDTALEVANFLISIGDFQVLEKLMAKLDLRVKLSAIENIRSKINRYINGCFYKGEEKYKVIFEFASLLKTNQMSLDYIYDIVDNYSSIMDELMLQYFLSESMFYLLKDDDRTRMFILSNEKRKFDFLKEIYKRKEAYGAQNLLKLYRHKCTDFRSCAKYKAVGKVAVGFFGSLRGDWEKNLEHLINYFSIYYNSDNFLFTWDEISEFPSINTSKSDWCQRLINKDIKPPMQISDKKFLYKNFPNTYNILSYNYVSKLDLEKIKKFNFKKFEIENQTFLSLQMVAGEFVFYGTNKVYDLIEEYEKNSNSCYDIIFLVRVDSMVVKHVNFDFFSFQRNTLYELLGKGGNIVCGDREIIRLYANIFKNRNNYNHPIKLIHSFVPYFCSVHGINIQYLSSFSILNTIALKGLSFPCVKQELLLDINNNIARFSKEENAAVITFFEQLLNLYGTTSKNTKKTYVMPYIGSLQSQNSMDIIDEAIRLSPPYYIGQYVLKNYKKIFSIFMIIFFVYRNQKEYREKIKIYSKQIKYHSSIKPIYLDIGYDSKIKSYFSYKLGQALIKAHQNWYKGGYIKFWFDLYKLKKEFKNKKG